MVRFMWLHLFLQSYLKLGFYFKQTTTKHIYSQKELQGSQRVEFLR